MEPTGGAKVDEWEAEGEDTDERERSRTGSRLKTTQGPAKHELILPLGTITTFLEEGRVVADHAHGGGYVRFWPSRPF